MGSLLIVSVSSDLGYHLSSKNDHVNTLSLKKKRCCPFHVGLMEMGKGTSVHWESPRVKAGSGSTKEGLWAGVRGRV